MLLALAGVASWVTLRAAGPGIRPPVFPALELGIEGVEPGLVLLGELNCTACHAASPAWMRRLAPKAAPLLGRAASRLQPAHVQRWLLDPSVAKPGTAMPDLLRALPEAQRAGAAEALTHFLWSLAPPAPTTGVSAASAFQVQQGRVLYHQVGCVACHAPFETARDIFGQSSAPNDPDAVRFVMRRLEESSVPLPVIAEKYTSAGLANFLTDPLAVRPAGRMPSLKLTPAEAAAVAAYLVTVAAPTNGPGPADAAFRVDSALARQGRGYFTSLGCTACHELGEGHERLAPARQAAPLAVLDPASPDGCLAETPATAPRFPLSPTQRDALRAALKALTGNPPPASPAERVDLALVRLNCHACHARNGYGGPTPSRADYFTSTSDADLGDEGRLPPHLTGVGGKLRSDWLGSVLTNAASVRPYMAVRMPQFGAGHVGSLVADFAGADAPPGGERPMPVGDAEAGNRLVGLPAYTCVNCHRFGPHESLGISVMDLSRMSERLRWDWFRRYLLDPTSLRPGTRMPTFWPDGRASVTNVLDGDTEAQIGAIWCYLRQGTNAAPPAGLLEALSKTKPSSPVDYE